MTTITKNIISRILSEIYKREAEIEAAESEMRLRLLGAERRAFVRILDIIEEEHASERNAVERDRAAACPPVVLARTIRRRSTADTLQ